MCLDKQYKSRGHIYNWFRLCSASGRFFKCYFFTLLLLRPLGADSCVAGNLWSLRLLHCTICLGFVFVFFPAGISSWCVKLLGWIRPFHVTCACGEVSTSSQNMHKGGRTCRRFSICPEGLSNLSLLKLCFFLRHYFADVSSWLLIPVMQWSWPAEQQDILKKLHKKYWTIVLCTSAFMNCCY